MPNGVREISLWDCLHDGELISCASNLLERFVTLEIEVDHLIKDKQNLTTFLLRLEDVASVRAVGHFRWPGKFEEPENASGADREALLKDYYAKWRSESLSWPEFEAALATDPLRISDACYVSGNDETTLRLGGFMDGDKFDDIYFDVFLSGKSLSASCRDGREFSFENLIALGGEYWEAFAARRRES